MNAPLYNAEILRLAASIPHHERLTHAQATAEKRSPICDITICRAISCLASELPLNRESELQTGELPQIIDFKVGSTSFTPTRRARRASTA